MSDNLQQLTDAGVSVWLDDLSRERIETGNLADLIRDDHVVGVTTNPSIFSKALADGEAYDEQVGELVADGADLARVVEELTTTDVRNACDILAPVAQATNEVDGRVSIEVEPGLAYDAAGTNAQAAELWGKVDRANLFIKIPGTKEGCSAIATTLGAGISVNVTLIFGLDQYADVMEAYLDGLELAQRNGHDLAKIHSVASFFVSRVDSEIDDRLDKLGASDDLHGKAGIANARLAYKAYQEFFTGERWQRLVEAGANTQRPLWASTSTKNPAYDDTMYVIDLAVDNTVNTMPEKTLRAVADHGDVKGDQVTGFYDDAAKVMSDLADAGIDYDDVIAVLIKEGVDKFVTAWDELLETVKTSMEAARK